MLKTKTHHQIIPIQFVPDQILLFLKKSVRMIYQTFKKKVKVYINLKNGLVTYMEMTCHK